MARRASQKQSPEEVAALKAEMKRLEGEVERLRMGYYAGVETYDTMRAAAERYIAACYAFQRAKWGKVRMRMSVESELR